MSRDDDHAPTDPVDAGRLPRDPEARLEALKADNQLRQAALIADGCRFEQATVNQQIIGWFMDWTFQQIGAIVAGDDGAQARAEWNLFVETKIGEWYTTIEASAAEAKAASRLQVVKQMPTIAPNGHLPNRAERRHPGRNR